MPPKKTRRKPATRAPRGSGTVFYSAKKDRWVGRVQVGRKPDGKPLYRELWGRTQGEVVKRMRAAEPPGEDTTVAAWATRWLASLSVRESTMANYRNSVDTHIDPALGRLRVRDVSPSQARAFIARMLADGAAPGTALKVRAHARAMFEGAKLDGLRPDNPFSHVKRPKVKAKTIDPFPPADLRRVVDDHPHSTAGPLLATLAATGLRLGEAAALDVADWDREAGTLAVTKTFHTQFGLGPPKSEHGVRTITHPKQLRPALEAAAGDRTSGPLFASRAGKRLTKQGVQDAFRRTLARLGLRYRSPHQLRHSVATALIAAGHPIGDVAAYLGDSEDMIVKTYLHATGADAGPVMTRLLGA